MEKKKIDQSALKVKKAKELAYSPAKSFMMTGLMLVRHVLFESCTSTPHVRCGARARHESLSKDAGPRL